jgi:hypothetical protein
LLTKPLLVKRKTQAREETSRSVQWSFRKIFTWDIGDQPVKVLDWKGDNVVVFQDECVQRIRVGGGKFKKWPPQCLNIIKIVKVKYDSLPDLVKNPLLRNPSMTMKPVNRFLSCFECLFSWSGWWFFRKTPSTGSLLTYKCYSYSNDSLPGL